MKKKPIIVLEGISKKFGKKEVLKSITFDINDDEIIVILGKSGCGKSTLLKILLGFYKQTSGNIIYDDTISYKHSNLKSIVGFVSQENSFYPSLTVEENLKFFGKMYNVERHHLKERIVSLLSFVRLENDRKTLSSNLSGGMKRRLEFAISLVHDPEILILDEPFTGLDVEIKESLWELIEQIKSFGVSIIITTHLIDSAEAHADRAIILKEGKIINDLDLSEIRKNHKKGYLEKHMLEVLKK